MNDQLLMSNYLLVLKSTVEVFVHGTLESSNNDIRLTLKGGLDDIMNSQAKTYDLMTQYGWYQVNNIDTNTISQTLEKIETSN